MERWGVRGGGVYLLILASLLALDVSAQERFVTIKSSKVNARKGPNLQSPVVWIYTNKNEPVKVLANFEQWRQIQDFQGDISWIHVSMLSTKRFVILVQDAPMYRDGLLSRVDPQLIANVKRHARCALEKEGAQRSKIRCTYAGDKEIAGWVENGSLWGLK